MTAASSGLSSGAQDLPLERTAIVGAARWRQIAIAAIMAAAILVRLYGITSPLLDGYHERQTQTAMVTRNLYRDGLNLLYTRYDFLGNTPGYAILEFPLHNALTALLYFVFGVHDVLGRLLSVGFAAASIPVMYRLARQLASPLASAIAVLVFSSSLTNIYLGRAFMPESLMLLLVVAAMHAALRWIVDPGGQKLLVTATLMALAFLVKTPSVLLIIPAGCAWLAVQGRRGLTRWQPYALAIGSLAPIALWSWHAGQVNAADWSTQRPESFLLTRGGDFWLRLSPSFYAALGRSAVLLLTPVGCLLCVAGLVTAARRAFRARRSLTPIALLTWVAAWIVFILAVPALNMAHAYYQLPLLPPLAILAGIGAEWALTKWPAVSRARLRAQAALVTAAMLLTVAQIASFFVFFTDAYDTAKRLPYHLEVAKVVQESTPPDSVFVLLDSAGDTALTYYADRRSTLLYMVTDAMATDDERITAIERQRQAGATAFVAVDSSYLRHVEDPAAHPKLWTYLAAHYAPIALTPHYAVYDLRRPLA